ncbi:EcsC family protein [Mycolicibacterium austroafricanum]|uniref:EcsC family protein n=1 Tax=Mycolicibacterium austroafricanum TaxID=39687 RepID=UPI001CA36923|nr:EcsC family protein [Mycolicibacterium austroafricanum]QZT57898.1 EcsC family protein [Mycolicibacterium austroafricanum]
MSDYERSAWERLVAEAAGKSTDSGRLGRWTQNAKAQARDVAVKAKDGITDRVPGADKAIVVLDSAMQKALAGLHTAFVERGMNSVSPGTIFAAFASEGADVISYDDVRELDLKVCDRSVPRRKEKYVAMAAGQGAATSLAVTGATVASTVSGGTTLGVAMGAVVVDITSVMVGMGRIVALVAAHYGYDVREPEEQVFASGVLSYSSAGSAAEKAASLAALSRLTQEMMRQATWKQLQRHQMVNVIQTVVTSLGFNLTKKKLAQVVPVAGVVINGGLNARLAQNTFKRAQDAYRLRFLTEKYGLDPTSWAPDVTDVDAADIPLVDEILDAEIAVDETRESSTSGDSTS